MNADRILAESSTVLATEFWKLYHQKISEKRATDSRACETKDIVTRYQGAVEMADFILGRGEYKKPLAERILDELENKGEK
jgi:hypothetical protein